MASLRDSLLFVSQSVTEFYYTGSIFPTSRWAARAMLHTISAPRKPMKILEVGAGTGPVTVQIIRRMIDGDKLVICELNPKFMALLKEKVAALPEYHSRKEQISFFEGYVQDVSEVESFDTLICALPFLNFDIATVKDIFSKFQRLSHKDTIMTYYEYIGIRKLGKVASVPRFEEIDSFFGELHAKRRLGQEKVWLNLFPINIHTVRVGA